MVSLSGANRPDLHKLRIDDRHRQKKSTPWLRWFIVGVALLVAGVGGAIGISHRGRGTEVAVVQARAVGSGTSAALLNASGYVTPRQRATVAAKVTGRVVEIHAEEGMEVEQEQILARLDDAEARLQLKAAQTQLDVARAAIKELRVNLANADRELRRAKQLHEDGFTSVEALDAARTVADGLRARMIVTEEQIRAAESQVALA